MAMTLGSAIVIVEAPMKLFNSQLDSGEKKLTKFEKKAINSLKAVTAAVTTFTAISINEFKKFEGASAAWAKVGVKDIEGMRKTLMALPPIYGKAADMAAGYYQAVSAGIPAGKKAQEVLVATAKATKAAREEGLMHADVMRGTTKLMAGFRGQVGGVNAALDTMFAIEKAGQTTFGELIPVIGDIASMSYEAGVSVNEMGGALALATQTAGSTSMAVTQMAAIFKSFVKPTQLLKKEFEAMGYASGKAMVQEFGLVEALQKLDTHAKSTGRSIASLFDDKEAMVGVSALAANNFEKLRVSIDKVSDSTGGLDRAWKGWQATFEASEERFLNTINRTMVEFGAVTAPTAARALDMFSDALDSMVGNTDYFSQAMVTMGQDVDMVWEDIAHTMRGMQVTAIEVSNETIGAFKKGFAGIVLVGELAFGLLTTTIRKEFAIIQRMAAASMQALGKALQFAGENEKAGGLFKIAGEWRQAANSAETYGETVDRVMKSGSEAMQKIDAETKANIAAGKELSGLSGDLEKMHKKNVAGILIAGQISRVEFNREIGQAEARQAALEGSEEGAAAVVAEMKKLAPVSAEATKEMEKLSKELLSMSLDVAGPTSQIPDMIAVYDDFYEEIGAAAANFEARNIASIENKASLLKAAGVEEVRIAKWVETETRKIKKEAGRAQKEFSAEMLELTGTRLENETQQFEEQLQKQLDYFRDSEIDKTQIAKMEAGERAKFAEDLARQAASAKLDLVEIMGTDSESYAAGLQQNLQTKFQQVKALNERLPDDEQMSGAQLLAWKQKESWGIEGRVGEKQYAPVFEVLLENFLGDLDDGITGIMASMAGQVGGMLEGGVSWGEMGAFLERNKEGLAKIAESFSYSLRKDSATQTETQKKLDSVAKGLGELGWIGSIINAGWQAGRGMTERSEGGMVAGGRWVEVGDVSTGDYTADPYLAYSSQKITGDDYYRTGGQQFAAALKTDDTSLGIRALPKTATEWGDPIGATVGNIGNRLGKQAGLEAVAKLAQDFGFAGGGAGQFSKGSQASKQLGLEKENYYRMTDLLRQDDIQKYQATQGWTKEGGFAVELDETQASEGWMDQITAAYKTGMNEVNESFNKQMLMRMEKFPAEYSDIFATQIETVGDFSLEILEGRINVKDWKQSTMDNIERYTDKLSQLIDDATVYTVNQYIQGGGAIAGKLTQDAKFGLMSRQFQATDEEGKGITTEGGDKVFMGAAETAFKRLEMMQALEQIWGAMDQQFQKALGTVTEYDARMMQLDTDFQAQIVTLQELGFNEGVVADIRGRQLEVLAKEQAAFREIVDTQLATAREMIEPVSAAQKATEALGKQFDDMAETAKQAGATVAELNELELMRVEVLALQAAEFNRQRDAIFTDLAGIGQPVGAVAGVVDTMNSTLDSARDKLINLGASQYDLARLETERFRLVHDGVMSLGDGIRSQFDEIRDAIKLEGLGGTGSAGYLTQIEGMLSGPAVGFETLESASNMLVQWYNTASADAQQSTAAMGGAMDQSTQAAAAWQAAAKAVEDLVQSIEKTILGIKYSDLNVSLTRERQTSAKQDYEAIKSRAMGGDQEAIKEMQSFASTYLKESQQRYASSQQYIEIYDAVLGDLEALKGKAQSGELTAGFVEAATAASMGGGVAVTGGTGGGNLADIQETFERLSAAIEMQLAGLADNEAVLNINWSGLGGESAAALDLIGQIFEEYGTGGTATITFMSEFVENFEGNLQAKMEALGFVAGQTGWDSTATLEFVAAMGRTGQGSWAEIQAQMEEAGIGGTITTQLEFAYAYDISAWRRDFTAMLNQEIGTVINYATGGSTTVTGAGTGVFTGSGGEQVALDAATSTLQGLAAQSADIAAGAAGYVNVPDYIKTIDARYPMTDMTDSTTVTTLRDNLVAMGSAQSAARLIPNYNTWRNDMAQIWDWHSLNAPPYADGGGINQVLVPPGDDGLIGAQIGEGVVSKKGMGVLGRINSGEITSGDNGKVVQLLTQLIAAVEESSTNINIQGDEAGMKRFVQGELVENGLMERKLF